MVDRYGQRYIGVTGGAGVTTGIFSRWEGYVASHTGPGNTVLPENYRGMVSDPGTLSAAITGGSYYTWGGLGSGGGHSQSIPSVPQARFAIAWYSSGVNFGVEVGLGYTWSTGKVDPDLAWIG